MNEALALLFAIVAADVIAMTGADSRSRVMNCGARPRRVALVQVAAVFAGQLTWLIAALGALALLYQVGPSTQRLISQIGVVYLCYLLLQYARSAERQSARRHEPDRRPFLRALTSSLTRPRPFVYAASLITVFAQTGLPEWPQLATLGVALLDGALWYAAFVLFFAATRERQLRPRRASLARPIDRILMLLAGISAPIA